jgi:hypothetical protein
MRQLLLIILICITIFGFSQNEYIKITGTVFGQRSRTTDTVKVMRSEVILKINDTLKFSVITDENGHYEFNVKKFKGKLRLNAEGGKNVGIKGKRSPGFMSSRDVIEITIDKQNAFEANFIIKEVLACPRFPDFYFKENSLELEKDSNIVMWDNPDSALVVLNNILLDNPHIVIEFYGNCDSKEKNKTELSIKRAEFIKELLFTKGIEKERIKVIANGDKKPIFSESAILKTKSIPKQNLMRAKNRRLETKILSFDYGVKEGAKKEVKGKEEDDEE